MSSALPAMSDLFAPLAALTDAHPHRRKLLVAPTIDWGRELLGAFARERGWIGWEPATWQTLAAAVAYGPLAQMRQRRASDVALRAAVGTALARAASAGQLPVELARVVSRPGVRAAVEETLFDLRGAAVTPAMLRERAAAMDATTAARLSGLAAVLEGYEAVLAAERLVDVAGVFAVATASVAAEWRWLGDPLVVVAPAPALHGRRADFAAAVGTHDLVSLVAPADGPRVTPRRFAAATPTDELRELLRRALADGVGWDDIEIAATTPDDYAIALEGVCASLGVSATLVHGLPIGATPVGRAIAAWAAETLTAAEAEGVGPITVVESARALRASLDERVPVEPAMAGGGGGVDVGGEDRAMQRAAVDACAQVLHELEAVAAGALPVPVSEAVDAVRESLTGVRAWTSVSAGGRRQRAGGRRGAAGGVEGRIHLTDLTHAGLSGRRWCAIVGLDAERTAGPSVQSSLLADGMRATLSAALPTTARRREERTALVQEAIERVRRAASTVHLSWATASSTGGREAGPSAALLAVARETAPTLTYEALRQGDVEARRAPGDDATAAHPSGRRVVGAVPSRGAVALDARDVWLAALADGTLLLDGAALVRARHAGLDRGVGGAALRDDTEAPVAAVHGLVPSAAGAADPRQVGGSIDASSLEALGRCALAWFYGSVLDVAPADEPPAPGSWLDAMERGSVLHRIFEGVVRAGLLDLARPEPEVLAEAARLTELELARRRAERPTDEATFMRARRALHEDVRDFVRHERGRGPTTVVRTELRFGAGRAAAVLPLPDGTTVALEGAIDRVDATGPGARAPLRIIDYKTGRAPRETGGSEVPFDGGRRLQLPLYAEAAEALLRRPVTAAEYRYPTRRGGGVVVPWRESERTALAAVVASLLNAPATGAFLPTDEAKDCAYCPYAALCRVRVAVYGDAVESPRAAWASAAAARAAHPQLVAQRARRAGSAPASAADE